MPSEDKHPLARASAWAEDITRYMAWFGLLLIVAAVGVTVLDIITRRSIGWSVPGLIDITQMLIIGFAFMCIPFSFIRESNVTVDFITDALPGRLLAIAKSLSALCGAVFMLAIAWYSWFRAGQQVENGDVSQTIGIPFIWYWVPLLTGCIIGTAAALLQSLRYAIDAIHPPLTDEDDWLH
jgi:TRAP-type C4-dicarboxylate transport system permease small subunit